MLEDRDYMRQPEFDEPRWRPRLRLRWSWTLALIVAYTVVLLAELVMARRFPQNNFFNDYLALSKAGMEKGFVWQLVTYQFMHAGWLHLLLNSWAIYVFGRELEQLLGARRFLALMFSSGILGGVFQVLTAMIWPALFDGPVVGASACAFGLVAAFALMFPERELTMLIYFIIPVRMRAKTLFIGLAVLAVMGIIFPWDNVANAAHLGGMAMGWLFVKKIMKHPALLGVADESQFTPSGPMLEKTALLEEKSDELIESEVDSILDKISAHGIHSLTARERAMLETARKKMARR
jgi:membrane associated rhomboid family serine protease